MALAAGPRILGTFLINNFLRKPCLSNNVSISVSSRLSSSSNSFTSSSDVIDAVTYDKVCSETLESLCEYFEELVEGGEFLDSSDVTYGDGVLTVNFGKPHGSYVINRQTPNKQVWLSSPTTGPKRYDFVGPKSAETGKWVYKHTGESLHELLQKEVKEIMKRDVDFFQLPYSKV